MHAFCAKVKIVYCGAVETLSDDNRVSSFLKQQCNWKKNTRVSLVQQESRVKG